MNITEKGEQYASIHVSSSAFEEGGHIPEQYTCDGENLSPPLDIDNIPAETRSLVLIADDPDAPVATWTHWLVWDMPVTNHIKKGKVNGIEGINDFQQLGYGGPCPPKGTHRYFFKLYALDTLLHLPVTTRKAELEKMMSSHVIGYGEISGIYQRKK